MDEFDYKYRLDLNFYQLELLQKIFSKINFDEIEDDTIISLNEIIQNPKKIKHSEKKYLATQIATEARTKKAKDKIQNAINILKMENKSITHYSISKVAGVSYLTVKKYITLNEIKEYNR